VSFLLGDVIFLFAGVLQMLSPPWRMMAEARDVSSGGHRSGRWRDEQQSRVEWVAAWVRAREKRESGVGDGVEPK
jgi:hypothetical protein